MTDTRAAIVASMVRDLQQLGLKEGDVVLARGSMRSLGIDKSVGNAAALLFDALQQTIGPQGTIAVLTFTRQDPFWKKPKDYMFTRYAPSISGEFANYVLNHADALRSTHPTNSFSAVGPHAEEILRGHDETQSSFFPMRQLMELDAKIFAVGSVGSGPGFSTAHLVQEDLGLDKRSPLSSVGGAYYYDASGAKKWFARKDIPGCSLGFWKSYGYCVAAEVMYTGDVHGAYSMLAPSRETYKVERRIMEANPRVLQCDNPGCYMCATRTYNKRAWPLFALTWITRGIRKLLP